MSVLLTTLTYCTALRRTLKCRVKSTLGRKIMFRKILAVTVAAAALMLGAFAANADAQYNCSYYNNCPVSNVEYPTAGFEGLKGTDGTLGSGEAGKAGATTPGLAGTAGALAGPHGWGSQNLVVGQPAGAEGVVGGTGGAAGHEDIAFGGSESYVLGYVGAGLVAFGAVAMGTRRKFFQGALD